jgi:hypothetical protein
MDRREKDVPGHEKWVDEVIVKAAAPGRERVLRDICSGPAPDPYKVVDLAKTPEESRAIGEVVAAANALRTKTCGLPVLAFSPARVHVLRREEFRGKVSMRADGKTMMGHIYLWRGLPRHIFYACLAHEMIHAFSFLRLTVKDPLVVPPGSEPDAPVSFSRYGMLCSDPVHGLRLPHFHGLNEAATEACAIGVRAYAADRSAVLDGAEKEALARVVFYEEVFTLVEHIVRRAAGRAGDPMAFWRLLMRDHLTGTDTFLAAVEPSFPGTTEVLRGTGSGPEEVAVAADRLGLTDLASTIRAAMS